MRSGLELIWDTFRDAGGFQWDQKGPYSLDHNLTAADTVASSVESSRAWVTRESDTICTTPSFYKLSYPIRL